MFCETVTTEEEEEEDNEIVKWISTKIMKSKSKMTKKKIKYILKKWRTTEEEHGKKIETNLPN